MIIIIPTIKYGFSYYNTFTIEVCNSNYHSYFFECTTFLFDLFEILLKTGVSNRFENISEFFFSMCSIISI